MTRLDERLLDAAAKRCGGAKKIPLLRRLLETGMLDRRACLKLAILDRMEELRRQGVRRCEAMVWVADEFFCSYEKVRKTVYEKTD